MTWLTLDQAVQKFWEHRKFGVHIFYHPDKDRFNMVRDSRNGEYAAYRIMKDYKYYHGFRKDIKKCSFRRQEEFLWTPMAIVDDLVSILESEIKVHRNTITNACIIDDNSIISRNSSV